jgi:hypothetical protein
MESLQAVLAMIASIADGLSRALKPRRIVIHPNAAVPAMPAVVIDRRRVRFFM